jgi:CheY-like chemotaxis protein
MDIAMPGADGSAVCQSINSSFSDPPPILMLTALVGESFVDRSYRAGAVDSAANGICGVNESRRISYINPAGLLMLGYQEG